MTLSAAYILDVYTLTRHLRAFVTARVGVLSAVWNHPINRGSKFHALRDYVLWNAVRYSMDARHLIRLPEGIEIIVGAKENYATTIYVHTLPDFTEMLFLAHLMQPEDLFADVGANVGMYSVWVAGATGARAIAIEPVASTFQTLQKNVRLNGFEPLIEVLRVAIGEISAEVLITTDEGGLNHVVEGADAKAAAKTSMSRLDDILAGRHPTVIKIDVEGFEMHVLRGALETLPDRRLKAIIIELQTSTLESYGTSEREIISMFEDYGFRPRAYDPFTRELSTASRRAGINEIFLRADDPDIPFRLRSGRRILLPGYPAGL